MRGHVNIVYFLCGRSGTGCLRMKSILDALTVSHLTKARLKCSLPPSAADHLGFQDFHSTAGLRAPESVGCGVLFRAKEITKMGSTAELFYKGDSSRVAFLFGVWTPSPVVIVTGSLLFR